jgi:beta-lactam-binding protein with PASTA domain
MCVFTVLFEIPSRWPISWKLKPLATSPRISSSNYQIRKIDPTGLMSTYALTESGALDTGQGQLDVPTAVAVDSLGNVYYGDSAGQVFVNVQCAVSAAEVPGTSVSGGGFAGLEGGPLWECQNNTSSSSNPQPFTGNPFAGFPGQTIESLAVDQQNDVYVLSIPQGGGVEFWTITEFSPSGVVLRTLNTGGEPIPQALAVDTAGDIYALAYAGAGGEVVEYAATTGARTTVITSTQMGGLPGGLQATEGIAIDGQNNLYVLTNGGSLVQRFNPGTQQVTYIAGTGGDGFNAPLDSNPIPDSGDFSPAVDAPAPALATDLDGANGIAIGPDGSIYIADSANNLVRKIPFGAAGGVGSGCRECGPTSLAATDQISRAPPAAWALNPTLHQLYTITSTSNPGVVTVFNTLNDTVITNLVLANATLGPLAVDSTNNFVYVGDTANDAVYVISGTTDQLVGGAVPVAGAPAGIAVLSKLDKAYVATGSGVSVLAGPSGTNPASHLLDIAVSGSAIVADPLRNKVYVRTTLPGNLPTPYQEYALAIIDATQDQSTTVEINEGAGGTIYSDSLAVDEATGDVVIADGFDNFGHIYQAATQTMSGYLGGIPGFIPNHVAADSVNSIYYVWDGYGNVYYLIPNVGSGAITTTSSFGDPNVSSVAVDQSTDQAYVLNCTAPNADGTIGNLTLWDGATDENLATLSLEIPATLVNSVRCGNALVDASNANPATHSAWIAFSSEQFGASQANGQVWAVNGAAPGARPAVTLTLQNPDSQGYNPDPFAAVGAGQNSQPLYVGIENTGNAPLNSPLLYLSAAQDPGSLQLASGSTCADSQSLAPGDTCNLLITFTPSQLESFSGGALLVDNAPDVPQTLPLTGNGVPAIGALTITPQYLGLGVVGQPYSEVLATSGLGTVAVYSLSGTLPPGLQFDAATGTIAGTPSAAGNWNFTINVTDSGSGKTGSQFYSLTVTDTLGEQTTGSTYGSSVTSGSSIGAAGGGEVSFGNVEQGAPSATQQINLQDGLSVTSSLQITGITLVGANRGDFVETDTCGIAQQQLWAPGQGCTINVTFQPTQAPGTGEVAELVISSNAPLAPVILTGMSATPLGAPGSLPVQASVDNGNPPIPAATSGCSGDCGLNLTIGGLSAGGGYVAFTESATNLPGPVLGSGSVGAYRRTTCVGAATGCTEITQYIAYGPLSGPGANGGAACDLSTGGGGYYGYGPSSNGSSATGIDATGQFVLFESNQCGSTPGASNQIYLRDLGRQSTSLISQDSTGTDTSSQGASYSSMSVDARYVAFESQSSNLVGGFVNPNGNSEVYWRDTCVSAGAAVGGCTPATLLVSADGANDSPGLDNSEQPAISATGRYVAYASYAQAIVPLQEGTCAQQGTCAEQVLLYDSCAGIAPGSACTPHSAVVSLDDSGNVATSTAAGPSVSADGRFVVFVSSAGNLPGLATASSFGQQVFLRDTCLSNGAAVAGCTAQTYLISQVSGQPGGTDSWSPFISADGRYVTFVSDSLNLDPDAANVPDNTYYTQVYEYTNCLAAGSSANCASGLQVLTVDTAGSPLEHVGGSVAVRSSTSPIDATGQYFLFTESGGTANPESEAYLASTAAAVAPAPVAQFLALTLDASDNLAAESGWINFGVWPLGQPSYIDTGTEGPCGAAQPPGYCFGTAFGGGSYVFSPNLMSWVELTNVGNAPLPLTELSLVNTQTGESAPFVFEGFTCGTQQVASTPPDVSLAPGQECIIGVDFEPTVAGTYLGALSFGAQHLPIYGTVTSGTQSVSVPSVVGLPQSVAATRFVEVGLLVGNVAEQASATVPAGEVIAQSPAAGTTAPLGSAVNLTVSAGASIAVPSVLCSTVTIDSTGDTSLQCNTQAAASAIITGAGLTVGTVTQQSSSTVPQGDVISESPAAGSPAAVGTAVNLVLSSGPQQVIVPDVVGESQAAANAALTAVGLAIGTTTQQPSSTVSPGDVISESPAAGASASIGSGVNLVLSSGPPPVPVPSVVGDTQAGATSALTTAGFVLGTVSSQPSNTIPPGTVISQDPAAGTDAALGSAVSLAVSSGVSVPDVTGQPLTTALLTIADAGLGVGTITSQYSATVPGGDVVSESPPAGTGVAAGFPVNLVDSQGPAPVMTQVPEVGGDTQSAATAALTAAGLTLGSVTQQASSTVPLGEVVSQSPAAGESVVVGSTVTLVISSGAPRMSVVLGGAPQVSFSLTGWTISVPVANNGNVIADNIQELSATLNGVGPSAVTTSTLTELGPGASADLVLVFPLTVTSGALRLGGSWTAGTLSGNWSASARVSVPALP